MSSKVMIVTPVFSTKKNNRLKLLLQNIYWIQQQTHKDFLHVIIDDGSTDETPEFLDKISKNYKNIFVVHKENGGSSSAINLGIEKALKNYNADFITINHSDDLLLKNSLEDRLNGIGKNKLIFTDMLYFGNNVENYRTYIVKQHRCSEELFNYLLNHGGMPFPTMLWEKKFFTEKLQGYDSRITSSEDWDIALRSAKELKNLNETHISISKFTVAYRIHDNNLGYKNLKDGTKWKCYKMLLSKHLEGNKYKYVIAKEGFNLLRSFIPEEIKRPLRKIRNKILNKSVILPYKHEFIEELKKIDYDSLKNFKK